MMSILTESLLAALWAGARGGAARSPSVLPGDMSGLLVGDSPGKSACSSESLSDPILRNSPIATETFTISKERFNFDLNFANVIDGWPLRDRAYGP